MTGVGLIFELQLPIRVMDLLCCGVAIVEFWRRRDVAMPVWRQGIVLMVVTIGYVVPLFNLCLWTLLRQLFGYPNREIYLLATVAAMIVLHCWKA